MAPDKKFELDMLLDTAKNTLQKLEDTFSQNVDITPCTIYCYREILSINRNCKELDRMLSSSYFAETKLVETIQTIKKELKREKAAKIARQVLELFESNCKHSGGSEKQPAEEDSTVTSDINKSEKRKKKGTKDGGGRVTEGSGGGGVSGVGDQGEDASSPAVQTTPPQTQPLAESEQPNVSHGNEKNEADSDASEVTPQDAKEKQASKVEDTAEAEATGGPGVVAEGAGAPPTPANKDPSPLDAVARLEVENALRAKDLCQEACRLLKEQIMRVHEDLEKKWQKLQAAGLLPRQEDEGLDDTLIPQDKLAAVEKLVATAEEATANAMAMLTPTKKPLNDTKAVAAEDKSETQLPSTPTDPTATPTKAPQPAADPKTPGKLEAGADKAAARDGLGLDLADVNMTPEKQLWEPPTPQTPAEVRAKLEYNKDGKYCQNCDLKSKRRQ